jgi:hypothetical protein
MDLFKFRSNLDLESEGVWIELGEGARIKVARMNNPRHSAALRRVTKPYRRQIEAGTLNEDISYRLIGEAMAEGILLDWEGLDEQGEPLKYSPKAARDLLVNPQLRDFRAQVESAANDAEQFRLEEIETIKNA